MEEKTEITLDDIILKNEINEDEKTNIIMSIEENPNKRLQKREQLEKKKTKEQEKKKSYFDDIDDHIIASTIIEDSSDEELAEQEISSNELYVKLELLKSKFKDLDIEINKNMSRDTLQVKYNLAMSMIETKHADSVAYSVFLLLNKCVERTADNYFHTDILDGLSNNVDQMRSEITDILKEMVETGELPIEMLTPQLRLLMIMSGVVIQTIEKNSAKKKALVEC